jgi:manganese-dependent ADP-ribose/CDP-alcohol diphosphatase
MNRQFDVTGPLREKNAGSPGRNPSAKKPLFGYDLQAGISHKSGLPGVPMPSFLRPLFLTAFLVLPAAAQLGPDSLRFAVIADPQFADKVNNGAETSTTSRCYRGSPVKMDSAVAFFNRVSPAFLLILGDYVDGYATSVADSIATMRDLDTMNARTGKFQGDIYLVLGNHEQTSLNKANVHAKSTSKIKQNYYSFDVGPIHFIVLDGNYTSNGADYGRPATVGGPTWTWTDTWIHKPQRDWLIADLQAAGQKPTIVSIHQNLHGASTDDYSVNNADTVRKILETNGNVTHVFQGHRHEGSYARLNGIHYMTFQAMLNCPTPATGAPTGSTGNGNNYSLVTIRDTSVIVDGQVRSPDRVMSHTGLAKANWTTGIKDATRVNHWDPLKLSGGVLEIRANGPHTLLVHDLSGRLVASRTGSGATAYALEDLGARGARGGMHVFTVRTDKGVWTRKSVRL